MQEDFGETLHSASGVFLFEGWSPFSEQCEIHLDALGDVEGAEVLSKS